MADPQSHKRNGFRVAQTADQVGPKCPACDASTSRVKDSRSHGGVRFRRRVCCMCSNGYFTAEQVIDNSMFAVICEGEDFRVLADD